MSKYLGVRVPLTLRVPLETRMSMQRAAKDDYGQRGRINAWVVRVIEKELNNRIARSN